MTFGKGHHLHLIDGSAYIFRAYHALPPLTRKSDGLPVGAVQGFCNILFRYIEANKGKDAATHLAVIFDFSATTFRNAIYPEYKAHRPEPPEDLRPQFPLTREATRAFNVACIEIDGYEADDIIATLSCQARDAGGRVTIVSSDKDLMQLVGDGVEILRPGMQSKPDERVGPEGVMAYFGVGPAQVIDVQAILGDAVDNVPGAKGIGEKSAPLVVKYLGSVETILDDDQRGAGVARLNREIAASVEEFSGVIDRPFKLGTKKDVEELFARRHPDLVRPDLSAGGVEALAVAGNSTAVALCEARNKSRVIETLLPKVLDSAENIRVSKRLVTLDCETPLDFTLESLEVREPQPEALLGFLGAMEFRTLSKRVADRLKVEAPVIADTGPVLPDHGSVAEAAAALPFDYTVYECVRDMGALERWIAAIRERGFVAVDTETTSLDEMRAGLVGVSLSVEAGRACYIPVGHVTGSGDLFGAAVPAEGQLPLDAVITALKPVLEDPAILKIGQNVKYDWKMLARHGIRMAPWDDTMLMSFALYSGLHNHGMDLLSEQYLGHKPILIKGLIGTGKAQIGFERVPISDAVPYAAEDSDITLRLWQRFKPALHVSRVTTVYETLERPLIPVLADMEMAGIRVDPTVLSRMSNAFSQKMAGLEDEIGNLAGGKFNVGSPKQLGEILFDKFKVPGGEKGKTGAYATGADVLEDIAAMTDLGRPADLAARVLDWRQISKLKSTYTDALQLAVNPETGRVHTSYSIAGANTGRLASTDPNLQNIPVRTEEGRRIREAFIAGPGMKLVSLDYSQIELRILAHVADIPALKQAFRDGIDIHAMTASQMFGVPLDQMTSEVRRRAKAINFGVIYGISGYGLARNLRIPRDEAQKFIDTYFQRFPGIREYMDKTIAFAKANGFVQTLFGRKIHTPEINSKGPTAGFARRAAINAPIQGAAADVIRRAMIRMPAAIKGMPATMLLQVHDELLFEVEEAAVPALIAAAKATMEGAAHPAVSLDMPLVVDAGTGANWAEAH